MARLVTVVTIKDGQGLYSQIGVLTGSAEPRDVERLIEEAMKTYIARKYPKASLKSVEFFWQQQGVTQGLRVVRVRRKMVGELPHFHSGQSEEVDDIHYLVQEHEVRKSQGPRGGKK